MKTPEKRGLGRGLSALMADVGTPTTPPAVTEEQSIPIEMIDANPDQPRRQFGEDQLEELAESIREKGIIQPLILRPHPSKEGSFQIVAGERRWRAAQRAKLHRVPAIVREMDDTELLEIAIIENVQRADLNPVEEAAGYRQLMDQFGHTQEKIATGLGKSRSHIANLLRLLNLPSDVQDMLRKGELTAGHARALVPAENASELARRIVRDGLSVRQVEKLVKLGEPGDNAKPRGRKSAPAPEKDADTRALEQDLSANLGMKVSIEHDSDGGNGRVVIAYPGLEALDQICQMLSSAPADRLAD